MRKRSLAIQIAMLAIVVAVAWGVVAATAAYWARPLAWSASAVAAGLCFVGAAAAMVVSHLWNQPNQALAALLLGMVMRMGVPLAIGLILHFRIAPLAEAGFLYYLLIFYGITLATGTAMSLPQSSQSTQPTEVSSDDAA